MRKLWFDVLPQRAGLKETLTEESDFFLVSGNSMLLIRVQGEIRRRFGRHVALADLFQRSALAQMAFILDDGNSVSTGGSADEKASQAASSAQIIDWAEEIKLQPELTDHRVLPRRAAAAGSLVVALTGASGFLGREVLERLLASPKVATVHAVAVRSPGLLADVHTPKLVVHPGNLSRPNLGLSDESLRDIFSSSDVVIHNGADTSFLKAYRSLQPTNVDSTRDIVRHSLRHGRVQHLHYVSTAGISTLTGRDLYEEGLGELPPDMASEGYILSKWVSELYLEKISKATLLPVSIHRPTAIVGQGAPPLDVISNLLRFSEELLTVPSMSVLTGTFQFVDVEECADDMVAALVAAGPAGGDGAALVRYFNHSGRQDDSIDVHEFGDYLGRKLGAYSALPVLPDAEWIVKAGRPAWPPRWPGTCRA
ncbi:hypothetical protein RB595_004074 [Gaeumannomyces hyphopodioides]